MDPQLTEVYATKLAQLFINLSNTTSEIEQEIVTKQIEFLKLWISYTCDNISISDKIAYKKELIKQGRVILLIILHDPRCGENIIKHRRFAEKLLPSLSEEIDTTIISDNDNDTEKIARLEHILFTVTATSIYQIGLS